MRKIELKKKHVPGVTLFALLLLFVGSFVIHEDMLGGTIASALIMAEAADNPVASAQDYAEITAKDVRESEPRYDELVEAIRKNPQRIRPLPPSKIDLETLWLARCIYSETKRPEEMELVAWVVRNRVETRYRGRDSYREVVLDPFQFSAFNPNSGKRWYYANLDTQTQIRNWQRALTIAHRVRLAEPEFRPFPVQTRHFYSERSMIGQRHPEWARGKRPVAPTRPFTLDERRFRFYAGVS